MPIGARELQLQSHPKVLEHQLAYPMLNWQLAKIDPAKETLKLGLRGETPRTAILKDKNPML